MESNKWMNLSFEYLSEDPRVIERMCVPIIKGIQESDVSACVKHYANTDILNISRYVKYKFCPKDTFVFHEGENPEYFYVIIKGSVQVIERKFLDRTQEVKNLLVQK